MIYLGFTYYYLGKVIFITYVIALAGALKAKVDTRFAIAAIAIFGLFAAKSFNVAIPEILISFRFHFGFIIFYLYFRGSKPLDVDKLLYALCFITLADAFLVNFVIPPEVMPNYKELFASALRNTHKTNYFGFYQRPFSFGGSPTITSCLLVALLSIRKNREDNRLLFLTVFTIIICISGSGYACLVMYTFFRHRKFFLIASLIGLITATIGLMSLDLISIQKLDPRYLELLVGMKMFRFTYAFERITTLDVYIGSPEWITSMGGDFALLNYFLNTGLVGLTTFFFMTLSHINRANYVGIAIILIASMHYASFGFFPGQIVLGYLLTVTPQNSPWLVAKATKQKSPEPQAQSLAMSS